MMTGSLCLTEILKSWKSCSSNRLASHRALSASASGVALPYFSSRRGSSEPALTPMRSETPASVAAFAIAPTWSSNLRMLPGLTRTAAHPASIAWKTYFGWKWMSAITGIWLFFAMMCSTSASSCDGTATRTISQPDAVSSAICCSVALMFVVGVVHIDWTLTGASAADEHLADPDLPALAAGSEDFGDLGHPEIHCWHALQPTPRRVSGAWDGCEPDADRRCSFLGMSLSHRLTRMTGRDPHETTARPPRRSSCSST